MKKFIITIDTEGDNLWEWEEGKDITTRNVYTLQRFQNLCNQYGFKPVWLSNWEMLQNDDFIVFIKKGLESGICELGMHLHAWNTPPIVSLPKYNMSGAPYLIEYPEEIMEEKIKSITYLIRQKFGFVPVSHRAGRWAMNNTYFRLLWKYGYKIDCSYTPGIDWSRCKGQTPGFGGSDYQAVGYNVQKINNVIEVPVTVKTIHKIAGSDVITFKNICRMFYSAVKGKQICLRPNGENLKEMLWLINKCTDDESDYLMFMLHSSELMPGGSPVFQTEGSIELLYEHLSKIFECVSQNYEGYTLEEYYSYICRNLQM